MRGAHRLEYWSLARVVVLAGMCFWPILARAEMLPAAEACSIARDRVDVRTRIEPVVVSSEFTSSQLAALAARTGQPLRHAPYGFYLSRVWYHLATHDVAQAARHCAPTVAMTVDMALIQRRIEVAADLQSDACLLKSAIEHYGRHAEADERAFRDFASAVPARIDAVLAGMPGTAGLGMLDHTVRSAFDRMLADMDRVRRDARNAVDTSAEVNRLTHPACSA